MIVRPARKKAESRVEADVVHRARHRLEADHRRALRLEPLDAARDDLLPHSTALELGPHGEWAHPSFGARPMDHVERDDVTAIVAPEHRALRCVLDRVAPDGGIEERDAHADHAVATIALGERVAEHLVQLADLVEPSTKRPFDRVRAPGARRRHQSAAPA